MSIHNAVQKIGANETKPGYGPRKAGLYVDNDPTTTPTLCYNADGTERQVVDTALTQTLTAKTLTAPVITTPTIDGLVYAATDRQQFCKVVTLSGATIHAGVTSVMVTPACLITRVIANITTKSTGASTLDVGYTATNATTASDTFLDGVDTGTAAALFDSMDSTLDSAGNAKAQLAADGKWITVKEGSGDTTGLVGKLYIYYTKL